MDSRLAIIIPVYNEADAVVENIVTLRQILRDDGIAARITLVDDGSRDTTWLSLAKLSADYSDVCALRLSRNFGKEAAICAGLEHTDAELYLVMDSDLQHPPRYIKDMLRIMDETGVEIVEGVKQSRGKESLVYKLFAKTFYGILKAASGLRLDDSSDFKLLRRPVVDALRSLGEGNVFFRGIVGWVGFTRAEMPFSVDERQHGSSRFSTWRLMKFAINSILTYTGKPLYITTLFGFGFSIGALVLAVQTLCNFFMGTAVSGFSTVILLLLIIGALLFVSLGIIGAYVSRIYNEVKRRPRYIISEEKR